MSAPRPRYRRRQNCRSDAAWLNESGGLARTGTEWVGSVSLQVLSTHFGDEGVERGFHLIDPHRLYLRGHAGKHASRCSWLSCSRMSPSGRNGLSPRKVIIA